MPSVLLVALAVWQAAGAQQQPAPVPSDLAERVEVRLVQLPLIARDRQGRPVTDLRAEEIVVKDRGRKMRVGFLEPLFVERPDEEEPAAVRLFVAAPGGWSDVATSSRAAPRHLALLVDVENDPPLRRPEARQDVLRFVDERLQPSDRVAVFSYDGRLHQELPFTSQKEAIIGAVSRAFERTGRPTTELRRRVRELILRIETCVTGGSDLARRADESCLRTLALEYADEHRPSAQDFLGALEALVRLLGGLQGHKTVLALSHGVSIDPTMELAEAMRAVLGNTEQIANLIAYLAFSEGARHDMDRLLELAIRERVVLHFIDRSPEPPGDFGASLGRPYQPGARPTQVAFRAPQADLEELAATSGGTFRSSPGVFEGLSSTLELDRGTYLLGYYVDRDLSPRQLAKVRLDTTRRGVRIAHRRGYYEQPALQSVRGEIRFGLPQEDAVTGVERQERETILPFRLLADPRGLGYEESGEEFVAQITLHVRVQTDAGRTLADAYHFIQHAYPRSVWERGEMGPLRIDGWVGLPPGSYRLVADLTNPANDRKGTLSKEIRVLE